MTENESNDLQKQVTELQIELDVMRQKYQKACEENGELKKKVWRFEQAGTLFDELETVKDSLIKHQRLLISIQGYAVEPD